MITEEEQQERMRLYKKGLSDKEIADTLFLSVSGIRSWRCRFNLPSNNKRNHLKHCRECVHKKFWGIRSDGMELYYCAKFYPNRWDANLRITNGDYCSFWEEMQHE